MTIYAIDTETNGLNTHAFIIGTITTKKKKEPYTSWDKRELQKKLLEIEEEHERKNECAYIYAHNMQYDYLVIWGGEEPREHRQYSSSPFIVDSRGKNGRIRAKYLSSTSLHRGDLKGMGEIVGIPKLGTPEELKDEKTEKQHPLAYKAYVERDAIIVQEYIPLLKRTLAEYGINVRTLLTGSQIGVNNIMRILQKHKTPGIMRKGHNVWLKKTKYPDKIHEALRGGRIEARKTGIIQGCTTIDINSHYPACLTKIRFPNLLTETYHPKPTKRGWRTDEILKHIGISRIRIRITKDVEYGVLLIRINDIDRALPNTKGQVLIGTWTHEEIQQAIQEGYEIEEIYWSITWEECENPFTEEYKELYAMKRDAKTRIAKEIAKILLNGGIGKLAQRREENDWKWANIEEHNKLTSGGWEAVEINGTDRLYKKTLGINYPRYYAPIINALVTAKARTTIYEEMKKIKGEIYYIDTDGIVTSDETIKRSTEIKYGKELGEWKKEKENQEANIYGRKTYRIGEEIRMSGVGKNWITKEKFDEGHIEYKRMLTKGLTPRKEEIGTFKKETRNLSETRQKTIEIEQDLKRRTHIIDYVSAKDI